MRIGYFNYLYDLKESSVGASVHVEQLAEALRKHGHHVDVYYLNRFTSVEQSVQSKTRALLKKKLWRYLNQLNALISNVRYFIKEWKIISGDTPDVILLRYNFLNFSLPVIARLKRIPLVLEVNAPMAYENKKFSEHAVKLPLIPEFVEWLNLYLSQRIIVVSSQLKEYYRPWRIDKEKFVVIPNGANIKKFNPNVTAERILNKYQLKDKVVLGFAGSFHYWHGLENLMNFIQSILKKYPQVAFLLVGEGPLKNDLEQALAQNDSKDKVIFSGYVSYNEMPEYLVAMDIVFAPYPNMDFFYYSPLKLYEYLSAGRAVVASRIGQIGEVLVDQQNGMLFAPGDYQEMLAKTIQLLEDPELRRKISQNGRKLAEEKYNWENSAKSVMDTLASVGSGNDQKN